VTRLIEARTLKGFRDYPPELMIPREQMLEKARQVYRSYGFAPMRLPAGFDFMNLFHAHDERAPVDGLGWGVRVLFDVVAEYCAGSSDF